MRIAVLADIHSNHIALDTCVKEALARDAEEFIFLGDYIGELACPQKTMESLRQIKESSPCTFIRGNKEDYWINRKNGKYGDWQWKDGSSGSGMLKYAYERLEERDIQWFEQLPISQRVHYLELPEFVICHGSPWRANEDLREDYDYIDEVTKKLETELTVCGHFHIQCQYTRHTKRIVNPGSVGVPLFCNGKAQFMILEGVSGQWNTEFVSLTYDVESVIREMDEEGLSRQAPGWYRATKAVLMGKKVSPAIVLNKACEFFERYTGKKDWRNIPEEYWNMACEELEI